MVIQLTGLLAALLFVSAHSLPPHRSRAADSEDFVAVGTNELATSILQHYVDVNANIAFSPMGVSALLAILAEGARGETRQQLVSALHLPAEREKARTVYKEILTRMKDKHSLNQPEFRNWFYIYKNYTVEQCFRDVLVENYLTEVRDVDNPNRGEEPVKPADSNTETIIIHKPIKFENTGVKVELPEVTTEQPETTTAEVELEDVDVDTAKSEYPVKIEGVDTPHVMDKDGTKVNVVQTPGNPSQEDSIRTIMVQEAVVMGEALKEQEKNKTMENIKEREEEMKEALEKDVVNKEQMKVDLEEQIDTEKDLQNALEAETSMMIAFNALYFKGAWKVPFVPQSNDGVHSFYISDTKKVPVSMMHAEGTFSIGKIAELDSVAIDLPYEGGRYSLLVVLPNSRTGLRKLITDLAGHSLCELSKTLTPQRVEVCLPSFEVQTTTKPIRALSKFGVSHVFNKDTADLSGITPVHGLFVQDMSQLVTLNVDLTTSSTNYLTASSEAAMTRGDGEKFVADRPFLYFVHDIIDNIIVVAGKVTNPNTIPDDFQSVV